MKKFERCIIEKDYLSEITKKYPTQYISASSNLSFDLPSNIVESLKDDTLIVVDNDMFNLKRKFNHVFIEDRLGEELIQSAKDEKENINNK